MLLISKCGQVFVSRQHLNFKVQLKLSVKYKKAPKFKHLWNDCSLKKVLWKIPAFCIIIPNFNWILQKFHFIRLHYISRALEKSTKLLSFFSEQTLVLSQSNKWQDERGTSSIYVIFLFLGPYRWIFIWMNYQNTVNK